MNKNTLKFIWAIVGLLSFGIGTVGVFIPVIPTVPFYLLTAYSFARSSKRLHVWFKNTKLYEKNLKSYVEKKGMSMPVKIKISFMVSVMMLIGFITMKNTFVGRIIISLIWVGHIYYFFFKVKTIKEEG